MSLIIFDCDGVLIETEALANQCEVNALKKLGYQISLEEYIDLTLGRHNLQITEILKEKKGMKLPEGFWNEINIEQRVLFKKELTAVNGVLQVVRSMSQPKCIASSSGMEKLHYTLGITNLLPFFEGRIFSTEFVKRGKPFPDIYLYAADKMGVTPKDCIVIEDSPAGIEGGLAAGMTVLAFGGGKHITPHIKAKIKGLGAHYFFDKMNDLPKLLNNLYVTTK